MIKIKIEGQQYSIPTSLMEITLGERVAFDKKYGKQLREQLKQAAESKDKTFQDLDFSAYQMELACKTLSFFGHIPLNVIENTSIDQVYAVYQQSMKSLTDDVDFTSKDFQLINSFEWEGDEWELAAPKIDNGSPMTFGEFLDAKNAVKDLYELGDEKWEALLNLCCVYFRKKGEPYDKEYILPGNARYELMKKLPLQYALNVGFFLSVSVHTWLNIYLSSSPVNQQDQSSLSMQNSGNG